MPSTPPAQIVIGPPRHGVTEYATDFAAAVARRAPDATVVRVATAADAIEVVRESGRAHLHVTDGLFGKPLEEAAEMVERITGTARVTMTLHDVPQTSDGAVNVRRRGAAYARMTAGAAGVVVSSQHEGALFAAHVDPSAPVEVIPLGTRRAASPTPSATVTADATLLMAGYLYPGKGHDDVIRAAALLGERTGRTPSVEALGGVSPGHEILAETLLRLADDHGVPLRVTGYLDPAHYRARCATAAVPVVAHRHYSASRSLLDWAEQGRRPVVVSTRYTREMAELRPGTLNLANADPSALADAIGESLQDPATTVLEPGHPLGPTLDEAAARALTWWAGLAW